MRISDWSSDVCLSDLNDRGRQQAEAETVAQPGNHQHRQDYAHALFDVQATIRRNRAPGGRCFCAGKLHPPRRSPPSGECPAGIDPARSEEHTYELQSLMRISYAVFSLKKKKQKDYIHERQ